MKRIWASVIIFILAVTVCILGTITVQNITEDLTRTITQAKKEADIGNTDLSYQLSKKAVSDWHSSHEILCIYMSHSKLEAVDQTLAGLPGLVQHGANEQFSSECDRGITQIYYLKESELPSLQNIF